MITILVTTNIITAIFLICISVRLYGEASRHLKTLETLRELNKSHIDLIKEFKSVLNPQLKRKSDQ